MRVLIVSEDAKERMRASSALMLTADAEVVEVTTALEAQSRAVSEAFDVLVVDGDMSPKGGLAVLYEIREAGELAGRPTPPALVMLGREQDRWLAGWAGANEVLLKPVDPFVLAKRTAGLVGEAAPPSGARESGAEVDAIVEAHGADPGLAPH